MLKCRDVSKTWGIGTPRQLLAVEGVNLEIEEGEFLVIVGPSGCGKSTLLYMIAGLEDHTGGELTLDGRSVSGPGTERCMIFQDTSLYPWLSLVDNVAFGLKMQGVPHKQREDAAQELLKKVGLGGMGDKHPRELSGGMKQRVAIARAMALEPRVMLMDEPFAALDIQTRFKLQEFLLDVWRQTGKTILFVTHHVDEAIALADRVVVFSARPGTIKAVIDVDMPRPRDVMDPRFDAMRHRVIGYLQEEVDRAFAQQETGA